MIKRIPSLMIPVLLFDDLWKAKAEHTELRLNASVNLQKASVASRHPALMGNFPTCSHMS